MTVADDGCNFFYVDVKTKMVRCGYRCAVSGNAGVAAVSPVGPFRASSAAVR
jgi:hypothetical protein